MAAFSFRDKVALITGGSRGLGLVIARNICRKGGRVALIARDPKELSWAQAELERDGGVVLPVQCDLLDRTQIESGVRRTIEHFGKIDILINNAGIIEVGPLEHMRRGDFERSIGVHFWGPLELIMQVIPEMRRHKAGRILNIASVGGRVGVPHMAPYTASKFALVGLSDALRAELACDNVYVTTVTPGLMRTGSEVHAEFKGNHQAEYRLFSGAIKLPFMSISAERAAKKILRACARGQPALIMPFPVRILVIANAIFPSLTAHVMNFVSSRLPGPAPSGGDVARKGSEVQVR